MKKNKFASTLIEAVVVLSILSIGIVWVYWFFSKSRNFLDWVSAKIEAIEIAREGIEALENIRNTNWLKFSSNIDKCWNVLNYNQNCINQDVEKIFWEKKYILINKDGLWYLEKVNNFLDYKDENYRRDFSVWKKDWNYCQVVWSSCKRIPWNYTRKIEVKRIDNDSMKIISTVEWIDLTKSVNRTVKLENILTNYKR